MFIDLELIKELQNKGLAYNEIEEYVEDNGIWFTLEEMRKEVGNRDLTLESCMRTFFFTVIKNKIKFCSPENIF